MRFLLIALLLITTTIRAGVRVDADEAERVLAIADHIAANQKATDADWSALFATAGYRDLNAREAAMRRPFTDDELRAFVASPAVADRRDALRAALRAWKGFDIDAATRNALRYLPAGASIDVVIYPLIKPKTSSFVFRTEHGMAIFLYLDPGEAAAKFAAVKALDRRGDLDGKHCWMIAGSHDHEAAFTRSTSGIARSFGLGAISPLKRSVAPSEAQEPPVQREAGTIGLPSRRRSALAVASRSAR